MAIIDNLISYWKMDESSGTIVDVHGNNDGTNNGAAYGATGKINDALDFESGDGDYVNITGLTSTTKDYSFQFWLFIESVPNNVALFDSKTDRCIIGWANDTSNNYGFYDGAWNSFAVGPTTGSWQHIVITLDSTANKGKLYINGSLQATEPTYDGDPSLGSTCVLGANWPFSDNYDGLMDEVAVWEKVLTSDEVTDLYNSGNGLAYPLVPAVVSTNAIAMGHNF